ncbi:MAG: sigma-70 family RNA polymerase sigma factor [Chloroflexi bacterium]|nr:MAG: sigma-70 family RNA polymerase sigma factor [Chloroflexota bacterium]
MTDPTRDEEKRLVEHAKRDPREFGALYDRHFQQIYRFVYSRVREQTAAEDVTSEVFMKALKAMPRYQDTGRPFAAWLYQIAVNAIADRYRTLRPAQPLEDFHDLSVAGPAIEEQEIEDIALAMGKTPGAVKLLIHRGVSRLRDEAGVLRPLD